MEDLALSGVLGKATPALRTWVAGGVYRLVRREFRWGDAPALQIEPTANVENVPPSMRIYALERSLSREERLADVANAPSDLVGAFASHLIVGDGPVAAAPAVMLVLVLASYRLHARRSVPAAA